MLGVWQIQSHPDILRAFNPAYAVAFLRETKAYSVLITLGALMLVVTGGEAMYADLGHFGALPIRVGWFAIAFPALLLNYLGQGALMLEHPPAHNGELFYSMAPREFLYPVVALATLATVIAAQGLISASFSLASQAVALGLFPRLRIIPACQLEGDHGLGGLVGVREKLRGGSRPACQSEDARGHPAVELFRPRC